MRRALVLTLAVAVVTLVAAGSAVGIAYWAMARRFVAGDAHALDGVVRAPVNEPFVLRNVSLWDGRGGQVQRGRSVVVNDGRIAGILDAASSTPAGVRAIDGSGKTLIPGLIDAHVHLMYDSGPDLLTRAPQLVNEWLAVVRRYPEARAPIVRRGQLKLKAGVTTMRVLGDGYYSLAYRDDLARWDVVGPRVLTAGLHVNGPNGYVTAAFGAQLDGAARAEVAVELRSVDEIERRLEDHIARGVDVIKIATTHGDMGFEDAKPDLPEAWVREIVRVAHQHGLKVTAHSYGIEGDWAAVRGGVPPTTTRTVKGAGADVVPAGLPAPSLCMGHLRRASGIACASGRAMRETGWARYVWSCGVLTVPILVWNVALTRFLPPALASNEFSRDIPPLVTYGENILRVVVMVLPFLMPLEVATGGQRRGLLLFAVGTVFYVLAWVPLMIAPQSGWSTSWLGFVAPAYTPIVWLIGLGLIGRRLYVPSTYRQWMYVALACGFVAFHVTHTSIVYARNYPHHAATGEVR